MKLPFGDLMKQAQGLQARMEQLQQELAELEVTGESGGGIVGVTMNGQHMVRAVRIDPSVYADDREVLEDLLAAACNDAVRKIESERQRKMGDLAGGLPLPPGFKFPFST